MKNKHLKKKGIRSEAGNMLLEAMMAIGLLSAIVYSTSSAITQSMTSMSQEKKRIIASEILAFVMEELSFSYATTSILSSGEHIRYYDSSFRIVDVNSKVYTAKWNVTDNYPIAGVSQIKLEVSWQDGLKEQALYSETFR